MTPPICMAICALVHHEGKNKMRIMSAMVDNYDIAKRSFLAIIERDYPGGEVIGLEHTIVDTFGLARRYAAQAQLLATKPVDIRHLH